MMDKRIIDFILSLCWIVVAAFWMFLGASQQNDIYKVIGAIFILASIIERKGDDD